MPGEKDSALVNAIVEMQEDEAIALARSYVAEGMPPVHLLELSRIAMDTIGKRFEEGEYFLPELMMAGEMLGQIAELVKPLLARPNPTGGLRHQGGEADGTAGHRGGRPARYWQRHREVHARSQWIPGDRPGDRRSGADLCR